MKMAQVIHSWRRVSENWESKFAFSKLRVRADRGFIASEVALSGGVCIVAGVNSGGKSRLIRSIYGEFQQDESNFTTIDWRDERPPTATLVDFFELLIRQAKVFDVVDLQELVESSGLTPVSQNKLKSINWVLGREYKSVSFTELENSSEGDTAGQAGLFRGDVVPYFQIVHQSGEVFGSKDLSRGELAVLTLSWVLDSLGRDSLYLFDEPDLMLSPHSSQRAIDLLVNRVNELKSPAFIATHSYHTLAALPENLLVHVNVDVNGDSVASRPDESALWKTLKVAAPLKVAFVVEDDAAKALLKMLLPLVSPRHHDFSSIWIAGDASRVVKAGHFPASQGQTIEIWGVLDGNEPDPRAEDNILKLPGKGSPEAGALAILRTYPQSFHQDGQQVDELFALHASGDDHDKAREIAEALGFDHIYFMVHAWRWWLTETTEGKSSLDEFRQQIVTRITLVD